MACLVLSASALLAACGGGSDSAPVALVASASTSAAITPTTGAAVVSSVLDKSFGFTVGVPSFGTTTATTLKLSGTGATPSFAISSAEGTASGAMAYGSCIFTMTQSTYPAGHPLALGSMVTVNPCTLSVGTAGGKGDGVAYTTSVNLVLGTVNSTPVSVTVSISSTGVVAVNNVTVGSVSVVAATGAGS
jgi:hypothetical protein